MKLVVGDIYEVLDTFRMNSSPFQYVGRIETLVNGRSENKYNTFLLKLVDQEKVERGYYKFCLAVLENRVINNNVDTYFYARKYAHSLEEFKTEVITEYKLLT